MAKQVADRNKKIKEEKIMKQKAVEERRKKLEVWCFEMFIVEIPDYWRP